MNEIAKFNVQLVHQGKQYKVGLREVNKNDTVKFQVAGRMVTPFEYEPLPTDLKKVFDELDKNTFTSETELMKRLKREPGVVCFSITKRVYDSGTSCLMENVKTESKYGRLTKEETYQALRSCLSSDRSIIFNIIRDSKLPDETLFEIADRIERDDRNINLAHTIREASRTFDLESAIEHICDHLTAHCIKEKSAAKMASALRENFSNGRYESIFDEDDFA